MAIGHAGLELRLHVARLVCLYPHQTTLVVLYAHYALWSIPACNTVFEEDGLILEIWLSYVDGRGWCGLKTKCAVPSHVLDLKTVSRLLPNLEFEVLTDIKVPFVMMIRS